MPKSQNQKAKLLHIMSYLERKTDEDHTATVNDIITYLSNNGIKAERKSIYDDLETLRTFGVNIEQKRTKNVGYYVANRKFELPELKLLVDAVQSSRFITEKKSKKLIAKIETLASENQAKQLDGQVNVSDRIKTMNESVYYSIDDINNAISENRKISFCYFEWNEKKQKVFRHNSKVYTVSPYILVWDNENYYLIGKDSENGENRNYRVDKMASINICDEKRDMTGNEAEKIAAYSRKLFGMFGGKEELVTLKCKNALANVMVDRFGHDPVFRSAENSDSFEFGVGVVISPHFYSWITSFGGDVKITSPETAVEGYREFLKNAENAI